MDSDRQKETLKRLGQLKAIEYIFTAHYGHSDNHEEAFKDWQ